MRQFSLYTFSLLWASSGSKIYWQTLEAGFVCQGVSAKLSGTSEWALCYSGGCTIWLGLQFLFVFFFFLVFLPFHVLLVSSRYCCMEKIAGFTTFRSEWCSIIVRVYFKFSDSCSSERLGSFVDSDTVRPGWSACSAANQLLLHPMGAQDWVNPFYTLFLTCSLPWPIPSYLLDGQSWPYFARQQYSVNLYWRAAFFDIQIIVAAITLIPQLIFQFFLDFLQLHSTMHVHSKSQPHLSNIEITLSCPKMVATQFGCCCPLGVKDWAHSTLLLKLI
jgi:hypothetical protein